MFEMFLVILVSALIVSSFADLGPEHVGTTHQWSRCHPSKRSIYDFEFETLDNRTRDLSAFKGHVLLVVNVATFCAYTAQYKDFNPILDEYSENGFSILAFPCNQFGLQELAKNHEILNGLKYVRPGNGFVPHKNLHVFGKLEVNGDKQHPFYEYLKNQCPPTTDRIGKRGDIFYDPVRTSDVTWNFEKFLIDRKGIVRYRFILTTGA